MTKYRIAGLCLACIAVSNLCSEMRTRAILRSQLATVRCERLEAKIICTEYVNIRDQSRYGDQPQITLSTGNDFAGINLTDGRHSASVWATTKTGAKFTTVDHREGCPK